jgi:hypothetical protein
MPCIKPCWADEVQSAAPAYQDKVISSDRLEVFANDDTSYDINGLPRSLRFEWLAQYNQVSGNTTNSPSRLDYGFALQRYWQTLNFGEFSLDGVGFYNDHPQSGQGKSWQGHFTLWQRHFFLNNQWQSDNGVGVLTTPLPQSLQVNSRIFLPITGLFGTRTNLENKTSGQRIQLAAGLAGDLTGSQVTGFERGQGEVYAINIEQAFSSRWHGALALLQNGQSHLTQSNSSNQMDNRYSSALGSVGWQQDTHNIQLNMLSSDINNPHKLGVWLDGNLTRPNTHYQYGAYYLQPDLSWAGQAMQQNAEGFYYRFSRQTARWYWSGNADYLHTVTGTGFNGFYTNSAVRYQANTRIGYGGSSTLRYSKDDYAFGQQLFVDYRNPLGQSRFQFEYDQSPKQGFRSTELNFDHALNMQEGEHLTLSAGYQQLQQGQLIHSTSHIINLNAYGGVQLTDFIFIDGGARWSKSLDQKQSSVGLNLSANWQIHPDWQLSTSLYQNQQRFTPELIFDPLQPTIRQNLQTQKDISILLRLRYQWQAGSKPRVIAGSSDAPTGSIKGNVFLDDNQNRLREASERGVAQVTVILDGRYSARTNDLGEFEFPLVAIGTHQIRVSSDELPLPYYFDDNKAEQTVLVQVRDTTQVEIGAVRQR